jgi:hypothetical protein
VTDLDRDRLLEVGRCGRPGTRMPDHDRHAYQTTSCYGRTKADLGEDFPAPAAIFLRDHEILAVVGHVQSEFKGKGEPTKARSVAFWGEAERPCQSMK